MSDLNAAMSAAASGLKAQTMRIRLSAENVANANTTATQPGEDPFRRRVPVFQARELPSGGLGVRIVGAMPDQSDFRLRYQPGHPAADENGYVRYPNVDSLVEMMDLREAQRAYEANLNMIEAARAMTSRALDLLRR